MSVETFMVGRAVVDLAGGKPPFPIAFMAA